MTNSRILTFQDLSCHGQCSITVALPILSACGVETITLPCAILSTHTGGFTGFTCRDLAQEIPDIISHWRKEKIVFDCLYTGYLGNISLIDYAKKLKSDVIKEGGLMIVDPVMADNGALYHGFDMEYVENMAKLLSSADIVLPNMTEAALLTGSEIKFDHHDKAYVENLIKKLSGLGPEIVILKGVSFEDGKIGVGIYEKGSGNVEYYFNDKKPVNYHGTGDCFASAFSGAIMQGKDIYTSAKLAADFVVSCIEATMDDPDHWYGVKFERVLPMLTQAFNK